MEHFVCPSVPSAGSGHQETTVWTSVAEKDSEKGVNGAVGSSLLMEWLHVPCLVRWAGRDLGSSHGLLYTTLQERKRERVRAVSTSQSHHSRCDTGCK